jgi:sodium-dependent dicarboxylate transporter 2/3/5
MLKSKQIGLFLGIAVFLGILVFTNFDPGNPSITIMAAVASLMAIWWISEAIPLAATSLIPFILFPLLGICSGEEIASSYINSTIFLFLGGFLIALSMEKWALHKRIALKIILFLGGSPSKIVFGFMTAAFFLSMWISNTATAVMMLPIGLAIIYQLEEEFSKEKVHNFSVSVMLGIAYGCSIGGISTLIGTPPNLSFIRILKIIFPHSPDISFANWLIMAMPISIIMLFTAWFVLTKIYFRIPGEIKIEKNIISDEYKKLGRLAYEEKAVGIIFVFTALLWIFRVNIDLGFIKIYGWSNIFNNSAFINDGTVAVFMAIVLFLIPSKDKTKGDSLLSADVFTKIPWGIILLFGGGFALAKGFITSGLSDFIGSQFQGMKFTSPMAIMGLVSVTITFMTELTSNTATTEMILPILASVSIALDVNPMLLMMSATLSASMAFMLPVATPPNAVIFGSQRIKVSEMAKAGLLLNLTGVIVITLSVYFIGLFVFNIDLDQLPGWIK